MVFISRTTRHGQERDGRVASHILITQAPVAACQLKPGYRVSSLRSPLIPPRHSPVAWRTRSRPARERHGRSTVGKDWMKKNAWSVRSAYAPDVFPPLPVQHQLTA